MFPIAFFLHITEPYGSCGDLRILTLVTRVVERVVRVKKRLQRVGRVIVVILWLLVVLHVLGCPAENTGWLDLARYTGLSMSHWVFRVMRGH